MKKLFIDIGGTHLRSELVSDDEIIRDTLSSDEIGLFSYIEKQIVLNPQIAFIGISFAGQVENGVIASSPNINIDKYDIASAVKSCYGISLIIDNDLNCAVQAEAAYWKSQNIAALFVGTGIGAAVIDGGRLIRGSHNMAYEIGHIPYRETPLHCGCGRSNCIELFASGSGMAKWLTHYGSDQHPDIQLLKSSSIDEERLICHQFEEALLHAAGVLVTLANPDILVLGGGVVKQNPYLATLLQEKIKNYALSPSLQSLRIVTSVLENAPLEGAKLLEAHYG